MPVSPRLLAVRALVRLDADAAFAGHAERRRSGDPDAERAATDLVAGVTRHRRWLDHRLAPFVRGGLVGLDGLDAPLRAALRLGAYELTMAGTAPHAAVGEAVNAARSAGASSGAGLVNAVLRRLAAAPPPPDLATGDLGHDLAVRHSHPTWLVRRWLARFGPDGTRDLLTSNNTRPVFGVRANTLRTAPSALRAALDLSGIGFEPSPWVDGIVRTQAVQGVLRSGLVGSGKAIVQDEAAALVVHVLDPQPGETVFDVCAAPGGKALYAAARMDNRGRIVASDAHANRLTMLDRALETSGATIVETVAGDVAARAAAAVETGDLADAVLVDAPCSGTGVLARRADLRWQRGEADLRGVADLQAAMLDDAAALVRPGGRLVYSTCSIEPEENALQVDRFLAAHPDFRRESVAGRVPDAFVTPEGDYAALPHVHATDGAYAARLVRAA